MVTNPTFHQADIAGSSFPVRNYSSRFDAWLLRRLYTSLGNPQIRIKMGDSLEVAPPAAFPVATVAINDRYTLLQILLNPQLGFGDAYTAGRVSVDGSLVATLETVFRSMSAIESRNWYSRIASPFLAFVQRNSLQGARKNIHRHYDLGTEFFRLWLDSQLVYSGAYFSSPSFTLEDAQIAKMEYICRKLNLQRGEQVVDIGCGWGALAFHMARHYGAHVLAVSNSHEQILWARRRAAELHLTHEVEFIEDDYRNISIQCDAVVSVGMLEHVGVHNYRDMGRVIDRVLDSAGRGLIQTIALSQPHPFNLWTRKRVFPGTHAPTLRQAMDLFEPGDLSVVDVENLRPHYARTLEHWLDRFENSSDKVSEMFGADFVRLWRLYLAGSLAGFSSGALQHFQILFARKACQRIPLTRTRLYATEDPVQAEDKTRMYAVL
jgi:cyclopropane-fatty-acyl-phospholipid synthase